MNTEKAIPVYCINLKRATERRKRMIEEWTNKRGIDLIFFDAIDHKDLDINNLPEPLKGCKEFNKNIYNPIYDRFIKYKKELTLGEISCSISHYKVLEQIIKSGARQAIVLEDDAEPMFDTAEEFFAHINSYELDQQKADIVLLHDQLFQSFEHRIINEEDLYKQQNHHILDKSILCTQSILYKNTKAMELAKNALSIISTPADWAWNYFNIVENKMLGISAKPLTSHVTNTTYINSNSKRYFIENMYNEDEVLSKMICNINSNIYSKLIHQIVPFYSNNNNTLEKYFHEFYKENISEFDKIGYTFLPIYWTDIYAQIAKGDQKIKNQLEIICKNLQKNKKYFTVSQHADAPRQGLPLGTVNFSAGGNAKNTISLPLICENDLTTYNLKKLNKNIFCSFVGSINTHKCRQSIFENLESKAGYEFILKNNWTPKVSNEEQKNFIDITKRSKFTLCPRGYGPTSWRLYEAMQLESVPVYIYDKLHLPYQNEINWNDICVLIHFNDIKNIDDILKSISNERYDEMINNIKNIYPIFFNLDYMCHYILETLKNYNKSNELFREKITLENKIYEEEDKTFSTFKCDTIKKIYTTYSEKSDVFSDWFNTIYNIYPNIEIKKMQIDDGGQSRTFKTNGWKYVTIQKLIKIIEIFDDPNENFFIYSDSDIQFFKPFHQEIDNYLKDYDIVFQDDLSTVCTGFFFCRKTCKVKNLFEMALKNMISMNSDSYDDQNSVNDMLKKMPYIKYTKLPNNFFTVGFSTKKRIWIPNVDFDIPSNMVLHHANFTIGSENKLKLLQAVRDKYQNL